MIMLKRLYDLTINPKYKIEKRYYFCPVCAKEIIDNIDIKKRLRGEPCPYCKTKELPLKSLRTTMYYFQKGKAVGKMCGDYYMETEYNSYVKDNPLFNEEIHNKVMEESRKPKTNSNTNHSYNSYNYYSSQSTYTTQNVPKCPLCQSTNISQISLANRAVHGAVFGLFSVTARSQWECHNCHNKW